MSNSNRKPGAESVPSGVGGSAAAGAAPLAGSLRIHVPAGTLVRINAPELALEQRDRIVPTPARVDLEFPDMEKVEVTGSPYAKIGLALELLKHGQVLTAISEIDSALRDARRRALDREPLPVEVRLVLTQLRVLCGVTRVRENRAVTSYFRQIDAATLHNLSAKQCVDLVSSLAELINTIGGK